MYVSTRAVLVIQKLTLLSGNIDSVHCKPYSKALPKSVVLSYFLHCWCVSTIDCMNLIIQSLSEVLLAVKLAQEILYEQQSLQMSNACLRAEH